MPFDHVIPDQVKYNLGMRQSLVDKIYFVDKVGAQTFIDYGCADGALLKFIRDLFPDNSRQLIGYDISDSQLAAARVDGENILFTKNWQEIQGLIKAKSPPSCLCVSSIIHEIYSYGSAKDVEEFWNRVWSNNFKYVAIRDMCVSRTTSRLSDPIAVARIRQIYDPAKLAEWESIWGSIAENWSLTHFLLTYQYNENWSREVHENYLPICFEDLLHRIPHNYHPIHIEHYTLPFLRNRVRNDFNIELGDRTHLKLILEKRS
jgi:hypothetical protein